MADLLLEGKDVTDTAIDGVSNPRKSLIAKSNDGIEALVCRNAQEKLGGIASAKHLVNGSKVSSALLRVKIGRKYATAHALTPQELAGATRPTSVACTHYSPFLLYHRNQLLSEFKFVG
jgi:hypothetical protein